nr:60 kDa neurofilament protein-like [Biomphalaria glabrata]
MNIASILRIQKKIPNKTMSSNENDQTDEPDGKLTDQEEMPNYIYKIQQLRALFGHCNDGVHIARAFYKISNVQVGHSSPICLYCGVCPEEKQNFQELNEHFKSTIENCTVQNTHLKKLEDELQKLKQQWGKETEKIRLLYHAKLEETKKINADLTKQTSEMSIKWKFLEEQDLELREKLEEMQSHHEIDIEKIERLEKEKSQLQIEFNLHRTLSDACKSERDKLKVEVNQSRDVVENLRKDAMKNTIEMISAKNKCRLLKEKIKIITAVHDKERKEWSTLAEFDSAVRNKTHFETELVLELEKVKEKYATTLHAKINETRSFCALKLEEFISGVEKFNAKKSEARNVEFSQLRQQCEELEKIKIDYEKCRSAKIKLENELKLNRISLENLTLERNRLQYDLKCHTETRKSLEDELREYKHLLEAAVIK